MRRREVITFIGGAIAWPLAAGAQQTAMPVIGFFHLTSLETTRKNLASFRRGLAETGYVENKNVTIEYRWAEGLNDRLPTLVAELVRRQVSVIVVLESTNGALAAKAATKTIPIVFMQGADPVQIGLVDGLSHPGGNLTGIDLLLARVAGKRLELLLELVPAAKQIAYLRNPANPIFAESEAKEVTLAASTHGVRLLIADASSLSEIDKAFSDFTRQHVDALLVSSDGFFLTHPNQIVTLAARNEIPAVYGWREAMTAGGLMSYGTNIIEAWRQAGVYTGRILKGERPTDLPVQQVTKVELIINLKAAKALGLYVPNTLIGRADEVIEQASEGPLLAQSGHAQAIYQWPEIAEEGGLLAYGPRISQLYRQMARQLVKLMHSTKAGDLPVEQPTVFELAANLKTAREMGLDLPKTLLTRADQVIE